MSDAEGEPTKFIRQLSDKANILALYEDINYARSLEFLFLRQGLDSGESAAYLSSQSTHASEKHMSLFGIECSQFRDHLHIFSTANKKREHLVKTIDEIVETYKHPMRIALQHDVFTPDQYGDLLFIEHYLTSQCVKDSVSVMVSYNTEFLSDAKIMQQIINLHDYVIFAPTFGKGIVVKTK